MKEKETLTQEKLFNIILDESTITWEGLLYDIVQKKELDPWDLDLSRLVNEYIDKIKLLKKLNFKVSGKVLLAAAILLKMKSDRLLLDELFKVGKEKKREIPTFDFEKYGLEPQIPWPRERRVTLKELLTALRKALEIKNKRIQRKEEIKEEIKVIFQKYNITQAIDELYGKIVSFLKGKEQIEFFDLVKTKEDIIPTFVPLIHMIDRKNILLNQEELFGPLYIKMRVENEKSN